LHARHAIRTGLITDKSISTLRRSGIPAAAARQTAGRWQKARPRSE
jgi:hypothetical protein